MSCAALPIYQKQQTHSKELPISCQTSKYLIFISACMQQRRLLCQKDKTVCFWASRLQSLSFKESSVSKEKQKV